MTLSEPESGSYSTLSGLKSLWTTTCLLAASETGKKAEQNPWKANSLEWYTSTVPPEHGNFGERLPVVHRWPYDFSVPGAKDDFIPQTTAPSEVANTEVEKT